jgi:hypothetical protein
MDPLPPFLFAAKTQRERRQLARLRQEGRIRSIGPRLYTSLPEEDVEAAIRGSWATIVSALFPDTVVSHRTALEYLPDRDGRVFLTSGTNRRVAYPGLTLEFIRGPGPLEDDAPYLGARVSSLPRALLENLQRDARVASDRNLAVEEIEKRLERQLAAGGEDALNAIRDRARQIADDLDWRAEYGRLDGIIGALLGTRPEHHVATASARARAIGQPFDALCLERLQLLFAELKAQAPVALSDTVADPAHFRNKAFFEAYFSNYIEGTTFEIEEAEAIVFDAKIPPARPRDAHDIRGTFEIVSDPSEMRRVPTSPNQLVELLRARHKTILEPRPEIEPGVFKRTVNRAGDSVFVRPELVDGTLTKGFEIYSALESGLARAIFVMFLVSDVHPFNDGNGRVARVMMNAELVSAGATTIIIPTVFRDDYMRSLKALTQRKRAAPLVEALRRAASFSHLDFSDYAEVLADITRRNWFRDPDEARIVTDPT